MLWRGNARQEFVTKWVTDTTTSTLLPSLRLKLSMETLAVLAVAEASGIETSLHSACIHVFNKTQQWANPCELSLVSVAFQWLMD